MSAPPSTMPAGESVPVIAGARRWTRRLNLAFLVIATVASGLFVWRVALAPLVALAARHVGGGATVIFVGVAAVFAALGVGTVLLIHRGPTELPFRIVRRLGMRAARVERWRVGWHAVEDLWLEVARDRP